MGAQFGAMVKRMHAGRAAQSGLYAALLAQAGFTGMTDIFEAEYGGFCTTFSRSADRFDLQRLTEGLGERFETLRISLKFYACVGSNHTTLDAIRELQAEHPFGPEDIQRIVVHASRATVEHVGWQYRPEGVTAAQLNLPFCVATLLLAGDVSVNEFSEASIADPARIELAERVTVVEDPAITARGAKYRHLVHVNVELRNGTARSRTVEVQRGSEDRFATAREITDKFERLAAQKLTAPQIEALRDAVLNLDRLGSAAELAHLLTPTPLVSRGTV